ncbi:MAG TPA: sigma-70 family RNA polymerase sigma factor [Bacteroidia bacterium]|nr:sigma-70 family RNA polymerase sigma factor [Bacteroidia bacterium]
MAEAQNEKIEETVQKEGGKLLNFIKRQVRDDDDALDIFQDVFSQLTETYRGLETIERVGAWLFRVAKNKIADLYRRKKPLPASRQQAIVDEDGAPTLSLMDILPDLNGNPEEQLLRASIWTAIEAAIDELPEHQRFVFVSHEFEELSFRELAELTGETENTLRMRKYHAVQYLRARLAEWYLD